MTLKTKNYLSLLGLLYCAVMLGTHYIITKQISTSVDYAMLTAYRFLIAAIPLYFYLIYKKINPFQNLKPGIILGFFLWLVFILISVGLKYTSAINTGFISGIFFIFIPFVNYFIFRNKPRIYHIPIILVSIFGIYLLTGGIGHMGTGDILILFSALFTAIHLLLVGYYSKKGLNPVVVCFQQFLFVFLLSIVLALATDKFSINVAHNQIKSLLFLGLLPTLSVFFIQMVSLKRASEIMAAILLSLQPGFSAFFAYWLGEEKLASLQWVGGIILFSTAITYAVISKEFELMAKDTSTEIST
jgi:drug/metabolite transporter (DMT)-like permease